MCDYSLHSVASRPAKVGDQLVATDFVKSIDSWLRRRSGNPTWLSACFPARKWRSRMTSNTTAPSVCSARRAWVTRSLGSGRSTCTIRMSTTMRSNFPAGQIVLVTRLDARPAGNRAAIAGAAHDRAGGRGAEAARRLRRLNISAGTQRDGRSPCEAAYLRLINVTDFKKVGSSGAWLSRGRALVGGRSTCSQAGPLGIYFPYC